MTMFFARCIDWSQDDGWEIVDGATSEEAALSFAARHDLDEGDHFLLQRAESDKLEFVASKKLRVDLASAIDGDSDGPDSQR